LIFATVGHHPEGFERLVQKLDEIAPNIDEEIIVQAGYNRYRPQNIRAFTTRPYEEVLRLIREARVVVCHGGGVVIDALMLGRPLIIVPRLKRFKEVIDNHQVELAERLKAEGKVEVVYDMDDLKGFLMQSYLSKKAMTSDNKLASYLREQVNNLLGR